MSGTRGNQNSNSLGKLWWKLQRQPGEAKHDKNLNTQFSGKKRWDGRRWYHRPQPAAQEDRDNIMLEEGSYGGSLSRDDSGKYKYTNKFGQTSTKYSDVAIYLSPTNYAPKRLIVQATDSVLRHELSVGDWRRCKVSGNVSPVLSISEWALRPFRHETWYRKIDGCLRVMIVAVPVQIFIAISVVFYLTWSKWNNEEMIDTYTDFPGYHWQWPKHAINRLDAKPRDNAKWHDTPKPNSLVPSSRQRLLWPRQLVVQRLDGSWVVQMTERTCPPYIFISYADKAFSSETGRKTIQRMSELAALQADCQAYWLDFLCRAPQPGDLLDSDVYRMCDVIRGSDRVVVMLPDDTIESKTKWGARMWTLPEAILAPRHECIFSHLDGNDNLIPETLGLIQMTKDVWQEQVDDEEDGGPTRLLAEHFANLLTLSRLELFSLALSALWERSKQDYTHFTSSDVAYALMGMLHYRIERDDTDKEFQSLAQLSLRNDSDRIVERMISLYPKHPEVGTKADNPFYTLASPDQFHTHSWDINPTCQVVGVAYEDNTVLVDSCRAIHIRWKSFPRPVVVHDKGFSHSFAKLTSQAAMWWLALGVLLAIVYAPFYYSGSIDNDTQTVLVWMVAGFLFVAVLLSLFAPSAVQRLYGGQVLRSQSQLVGFEGTIPIAKLEHLIFGQNNSRLSYGASSSPLMEEYRNKHERVGLEPWWITEEQPVPASVPIPEGHRLFTLVDTGELTVNIFSAERPPTVALICGHEGGMLRAVLCSWRFENDCLYREAVLRMPSSVWGAATPKGWLKLCLKSLNQVRDEEREKQAKRE